MDIQITPKGMKIIEKMQVNELTEHVIYAKIAAKTKDPKNKQVLQKISDDELVHASIWQNYSKKELKPNGWSVAWHVLLCRILGFTFVLKKLENNEEKAAKHYGKIIDKIPEAAKLSEDENRHEETLIAMLDEERLQYVGAMVLGINDALVEISGTLAGLTFALKNSRVIALAGIITGISATLSMAASEYLSVKESGGKDAVKSCTYTGIAYLFSVAFLVLPYLLMPTQSYLQAMFIMLGVVILIILGFTYYTSVAKSLAFFKRFGEMAGISISVALISFLLGILVKKFLGVDI